MLKRFVFLLAIVVAWSCGPEQSSKEAISDKNQRAKQREAKQQQAKQKRKQEKKKNREKKNWPDLDPETYKDYLLKYGKKNRENKILIETDFGKIKVRLSNETPLHRANFVMLTELGYFNTTVFYRVVDDFVVQGGNSDEWETQQIKAKVGNYRIEPEFHPDLFHKRGALAMARNYSDNPDKLSSAYTFYIVQRGPVPEGELKFLEKEKGKNFTPEQYQHYLNHGGTPSLDREHTVFGEVYEGMAVVDSIAKVETDGSDWPKNDVDMKVSIIK